MTKQHAILAKSIGTTLLRSIKLSSFVAIWLVLCSGLNSSKIPSELERVLSAGKISMLSRNGPTTYFEGPQGPTGFEYILASAFAKHLGVELTIVEEGDLGAMINALSEGKYQFAGAGLTATEQRRHKVDFGPAYLDVTQKLIYRSGSKRPRKIEDIYGKTLVVIANSSHEESLIRLKRNHPELKWEARADIEMMELLELVHIGEFELTLVDSNAYDLNRILYPKARAAFDISEPEQLAWAFPKHIDKSLYKQAEIFFALEETQTLISEALETYYGHIGELNVSDSLVFMKRLDTRLPKWRDELQKAAMETELDWQLLAAISYQESHWNPRAVSPTGVKGFMMLTLPTAKDVGVTNRLDAIQSIHGGAKYFKSIYRRIPKRIQDPDRTWLALSAYNIGLGHLEDARKLTQHHGGNPDKWVDVRENLLLLSKRKYYKFTAHGYARGWESVGYVQNIRNFYNMIAWNERNIDQQVAQNDEQPDYEEFSPVVSEAVKTLSTPSADL